jgi:CHAD domain-containing protein
MADPEALRHRWAPVVVPMREHHGTDAFPDATTGDVVRAALAASVQRLDDHESGVRSGEDPEDVHQARVAVRRLRSDLRCLGDVIERRWAGALRSELRWLADELGGVRDADVLILRFRSRINELPLVDGLAAEALLDRLRAGRSRARADLMTALDSRRYAELHHRLADAVDRPHLRTDAATPAIEAMPRLVGKPWKRLRRAVHRVGHDPSDDALHAVRIATKRCRYAAEAATPALGDGMRRFAKALAKLQDRLGDHQDAIIAGAWLRGATAGAPADLAFVAGELAAIEHRSAIRARSRWPAAWRAVKRNRP